MGPGLRLLELELAPSVDHLVAVLDVKLQHLPQGESFRNLFTRASMLAPKETSMALCLYSWFRTTSANGVLLQDYHYPGALPVGLVTEVHYAVDLLVPDQFRYGLDQAAPC